SETRQALQRQTAVADVLRTISHSAFDLGAVLDIVVEHATRLCGAVRGILYSVDSGGYRLAAIWSARPLTATEQEGVAAARTRSLVLADLDNVVTRTVRTKRPTQVDDVLADNSYRKESITGGGARTRLSVPISSDASPL